jgi:hypothetical protein
MFTADTIPFLLPMSLKASTGAGVVFRLCGSLTQGRGIDTAVPFLLPGDDWAASIVWRLQSLRGMLRT